MAVAPEKHFFPDRNNSLLDSRRLNRCMANGSNSPSLHRPPFISTAASASPQVADERAPPEKSGGFDGKRAFAHVAKQVSFGPPPFRVSGHPAIAGLSAIRIEKLRMHCGDGCLHRGHSGGPSPDENILVNIPGEKPGVILLGTHYDTKRLTISSAPMTAAPHRG